MGDYHPERGLDHPPGHCLDASPIQHGCLTAVRQEGHLRCLISSPNA